MYFDNANNTLVESSIRIYLYLLITSSNEYVYNIYFFYQKNPHLRHFLFVGVFVRVQLNNGNPEYKYLGGKKFEYVIYFFLTWMVKANTFEM